MLGSVFQKNYAGDTHKLTLNQTVLSSPQRNTPQRCQFGSWKQEYASSLQYCEQNNNSIISMRIQIILWPYDTIIAGCTVPHHADIQNAIQAVFVLIYISF